MIVTLRCNWTNCSWIRWGLLLAWIRDLSLEMIIQESAMRFIRVSIEKLMDTVVDRSFMLTEETVNCWKTRFLLSYWPWIELKTVKNSQILSAASMSRNFGQIKLKQALEFFLNGTELLLNSVNSEKLINHWSMNWAQFKDPISHMCLAGAVVACSSLAQEVAGWQVRVLIMS